MASERFFLETIETLKNSEEAIFFQSLKSK